MSRQNIRKRRTTLWWQQQKKKFTMKNKPPLRFVNDSFFAWGECASSFGMIRLYRTFARTQSHNKRTILFSQLITWPFFECVFFLCRPTITWPIYHKENIWYLLLVSFFPLSFGKCNNFFFRHRNFSSGRNWYTRVERCKR